MLSGFFKSYIKNPWWTRRGKQYWPRRNFAFIIKHFHRNAIVVRIDLLADTHVHRFVRTICVKMLHAKWCKMCQDPKNWSKTTRVVIFRSLSFGRTFIKRKKNGVETNGCGPENELNDDYKEKPIAINVVLKDDACNTNRWLACYTCQFVPRCTFLIPCQKLQWFGNAKIDVACVCYTHTFVLKRHCDTNRWHAISNTRDIVFQFHHYHDYYIIGYYARPINLPLKN